MEWTSLPIPRSSRRFFLSYRSLNSGFAAALRNALIEAGQVVWRDRADIQVGDQWEREIEHALRDHDDVVLLLTHDVVETPDRPDARNQVLREIELADRLGKRILCFSTVDVRRYPVFYKLLEDKNYDELPAEVAADLAGAPDAAAEYVAQRILHPLRPAHPASLRDFERVAVRSVYPPFEDLMDGRGLASGLLATYAGYAEHLSELPERSNALVLLNAALLAAHQGEWRRAYARFKSSLTLQSDALTMYYFACALMQRKRPRHLRAVQLDRCAELAQEAWRLHRSPLFAIAMLSILWDAGKVRGQQAQDLFVEAANQVFRVGEESGEIRRLLWFLPLEKGLELPVDADRLRDHLVQNV